MAEIVVKDKKDDNVEKALDIVSAQQKIVGKAVSYTHLTLPTNVAV